MNIVLTALAFSLVLLVALLALFRPFHDLRRVRVAFELIENQFEELRAEVKSALGRMYRLKSATITNGTQPEGSVESDVAQATDTALPSLSQHQQRVNAQILARRRRL